MRARIKAFTAARSSARCAASISCGLVGVSKLMASSVSSRGPRIALHLPRQAQADGINCVDMKQLLRTTDPTEIAFARALLSGEGIDCFELDVNMSILDGGIGALPRRLMVADRDHAAAFRALRDNGLSPLDE